MWSPLSSPPCTEPTCVCFVPSSPPAISHILFCLFSKVSICCFLSPPSSVSLYPFPPSSLLSSCFLSFPFSFPHTRFSNSPPISPLYHFLSFHFSTLFNFLLFVSNLYSLSFSLQYPSPLLYHIPSFLSRIPLYHHFSPPSSVYLMPLPPLFLQCPPYVNAFSSLIQ